MSQTKFLETVEMWTTEECQQNLAFALPKLISCLEDDHSISQKDTLKLIFNQFAPLLSLQESEEKIINNISGWLNNLFRSSFELIEKHATSDFLASLDLIKHIFEELCFVMDYLTSYLEKIITTQKEIYIRYVSSLCTVTLNIVYSSYCHCKQSVEVYGGFLEMINESLDYFFIKTGALLTKLNDLLQTILVQSPNDFHIVISILGGLKQIGEIIFDMDIRMMTSVWRLYIKIAIENEKVIKQHFEIGPTIEIIINQLSNRLEKLKHIKVDDEIIFLKLLRMSGFLLKVIVLLCDAYGENLGHCQKSLLNLILFLYSISPPSLYAVSSTPALSHELNQQLTVGVNPLIEKLMHDSHFLRLVLEDHQSDEYKESGFGRCVLLLTILEKLPKLKKQNLDQLISQMFNKKPLSILSAIFNCLFSCHVELALPLYLTKTFLGKECKKISMYEYICTRLCSFIACLPARHFYYLETLLINNLLSPYYWNRQMAMDVWSFLGRFLLPDLCYHHCSILTHILTRLHTSDFEVVLHVECLWHRFIHFLSPEYLETFSKSHSELITYKMNISNRSPSCLIHLVKILYEKSKSTLTVFINSPSDVSESDLLSSFQVAYKISQIDRTNDNDTLTFLTPIVASLHKTRALNYLLKFNSKALLESFLLLTSDLIYSFSSEGILHVLRSCDVIVNSLNTTARLYVTRCLKNLKGIKFDSSVMNETLKLITVLYSNLLQDSNWIIRDFALDAFSSFAHETIYLTVISNTIANNLELKECVSTYLNQIPWKCETTLDAISFLKTEQLAMYKVASSNNQKCPLIASVDVEKIHEEKIEIILKTIQLNVTNLLEYSRKQSLPNWAKEELNQIQNTLKSISD